MRKVNGEIMKRIVSILIIFAMVVSLVPSAAVAENVPAPCKCEVCEDCELDYSVSGNIFAANNGLTNEQLARFIKSGKIPSTITYFEVRNSELSDISPLAMLPNLKSIDLHATQVSDISVLAKLTRLEEILIAWNRIKSLSPLEYLENLHTVSVGFNYIDLTDKDTAAAIEMIQATVDKNNGLFQYPSSFGYTPQFGDLISEEALDGIKANGITVNIILQNGKIITIDPSRITTDARSIDLNIDIEITNQGNQISGIPANSIVIRPFEHGEFGFEIGFDITAEEMQLAGLNGSNARLYHFDNNGNVVQDGRVTRNADGSVTIGINRASYYVLSESVPETPPAKSLPNFIAPIEPIPDTADWIAISDRAGLEAIADNAQSLGGKYYLTKDIDLSGEEWIPIGIEDKPFKGIFDGQGFVIHNMTITENRYMAGLFGYAEGAIIRNVGLNNTTHINDTSSHVGGIVGCAEWGSIISNCYNTGDIIANSNWTGGIVGAIHNSTIIDCYNTSDIISSTAGGIVGGAGGESEIYNCFNTGNISSQIAGGIAGNTGGVIIARCFNAGDVIAPNENYAIAGGITGTSQSDSYEIEFSDCYNTGSITAITAGGITGEGYVDSITNCYSVCDDEFDFTEFDFASVWTYIPNVNNGLPVLRVFEKLYTPDTADSQKHTITTLIEPSMDFKGVFLEKDLVINTQGKSLCAKTAEAVPPAEYEVVAEGYPFSKWGLKNAAGEIVVPVIYDEIGFDISPGGLIMVGINTDGKDAWGNQLRNYGFVNTKGEVVVPIEYNNAYKFSDGLAAVSKDGLWGFIDEKGEVVIPLEYDDVYSANGKRIGAFTEGLAIVKKGGEYNSDTDEWNGGWGVIDTKGEITIPFMYYNIRRSFDEDIFEVAKPWGIWGVVDSKNEIIIPIEFYSIRTANLAQDGIAFVRNYDKWGVINTELEFVVPLEYDSIGNFSEGLVSVRKGSWDTGKLGVVDTTGKIVVPIIYDGVGEFSNGLARVFIGNQWTDGKWGVVDTTGKVVIPIIYDKIIGDFNQDLAIVQKDNKWGAVDTNGKVVIPIIYDSIRGFNDGLSIVGLDGKFGVIDLDNNIIIPFDYSQIEGFRDGFSVVAIGGEWKFNMVDERILIGGEYGIIDTKGEIVIPIEYQNIIRAGKENGSEYIWIEKDYKWGVVAITAQGGTPPPKITPPDTSIQYKKITPQQAKQIMDSYTPHILLDVRTQSEFDEQHIEGARLIPHDEITAKAAQELPDKDVLILLYCRSGIRSASAANALIELGYTNVLDFGGILDWPYFTPPDTTEPPPDTTEPPPSDTTEPPPSDTTEPPPSDTATPGESGTPPKTTPTEPPPAPPAKVTIMAALEIFKQLAGMENKAPKNSTISDALEILKYLAGMKGR